MLPENPALVKCPACGTLLVPLEHRCEAPDDDDWIMQAAFTGQCLPSFEEYLMAAGELLDEKTACMLALHARNDPYREQGEDGPAEEPCTETAFIELAERLGALLDTDDPDERLLRAELFREVGDFDRCIALLDMRSPTGDERDDFAARMLDAARKGLRRVFAFE
ncbi:hypothetical protein [Alistipes sp.]|uniref:hypothetical protein n=1 Tax=Alistipes sp. TaxID=1872444 RepID=UPI003AEF96D9